MIFLLILIFSQVARSESVEPLLDAANGNNTILQNTIITAFVSSPRNRGTLDILWSCIITILACVYTAIHLHVPKPRTSQWTRIRSKLRWTAIALLAPELILHSVSCQFREVRSLIKTLNKLQIEHLPISRENDTVRQPVRFSMTYGFLVVMGGLVINTKDLHETCPQITLTTFGVELLARNGHFILLSDEEILDRSKANLVAKALVCVQVFWMFIQCTVRGVSGLPLSLLEIHTVVHVVCALCVYTLWWKKPLDIEFPFPVDDSKFRDITALMIMGSDCIPGAYEAGSSYYVQAELTDLWTKAQSADSWKDPTPMPTGKDAAKSLSTELSSVSVSTDEPALAIPRETSALKRIWLGHQVQKDYFETKQMNIVDDLRWKLAAQALTRFGWQGLPTRTPAEYDWKVTPFRGLSKSVASHCIDSTYHEEAHDFVLMETGSVNLSSLIFLVLPFIYGGLHLLAWNFEFPTPIEHLLWKISALYIMACIPSVAVCMFLWGSIEEDSWQYTTFRPFSLGFMVLSGCFWVACRSFLMVESFISLRRVPLGVFATPSWLQSIPHT